MLRLAWAPPDKIFTIGIGSKSAPSGWKYRATDLPVACAAAFATANDVAKVEFAPIT